MSIHSQEPPQQQGADTASLFMVVLFPCLRCGGPRVPIFPRFFISGRGASMFTCRSCEAKHYLSVTRQRGAFAVCYQRYTLRYPLEYYDKSEMPPVATLKAPWHSACESDDEMFAGPIVVYPRKRRFSRSEVEVIWRATKGCCHICTRRWHLDQRGARGWHIDHVIPHIGGGREADKLPNFRVACATCNLKKGKGFTEASIRLGLRRLVELLAQR